MIVTRLGEKSCERNGYPYDRRVLVRTSSVVELKNNSDGRMLRRAARVAAFVGGVPIAISMVFGTWIIDDPYRDAVPSTAQGVGTCHRFATVEEYYNIADLRPPVPCTEPHQTETFAVGKVTGALSKRAEPPGLEALNTARAKLCQDGPAILKFLGAAPRDEYAFLQLVVRLPAPGEWRSGSRTYRCELMATEKVNGGPPVLLEPLGNAFSRSYGDWFRRCATGERLVPCARPHNLEYVNAWLPAPTDMDLDSWAADACAPYVSEYLGIPLTERYRATAILVDGQDQTAACQLTSADGASWTGSRSVKTAGAQR